MMTLVHRLSDSAEHYSRAVAIKDNNGETTYETLWQQAQAVACHLRSDGLQVGERVALLLDNSATYAAVYYGILAAGGVVVALNTTAKSRDICNWVQHCGARYLVANARHPEYASIHDRLSSKTQFITLGESESVNSSDLEQILSRAESLPSLSHLDDITQPAAIIYTSGTTGAPKGVTLSHRNLSANIQSILDYLAISHNDSILNVLPFYYSYGNSVLHTHLATGGRIVLENSLMYPHQVVEKMAAEHVTGFSGVPSTFALLLSRTNLTEYDLLQLRYITQAGGPMPPAITQRLQSILPHARIFVMYGQTEATARLSYLPPEKLTEKMGSIGIAIPGVVLEIHDEQGQVCPPCITGEICARGDNIMLGYWNAPDTTAQVLRNGWLHTGDLAHTDEDGYLFIDGRSSDMIKSGANRISPKEIEEVIAELDSVEEVGVVGVADEILGQVIKAVIVIKPGRQLSEMTVKSHCQKNMAAYKVPKYIEFAPSLPKTTSGKLQRFMLL